jgi:phosphoenolpyruvate---glycerone phosphotransferase subunit DhaL
VATNQVDQSNHQKRGKNMANPNFNLYNAFQTVAGVLSENQSNLNQSDTYNHNHGDNMVNNFNVITRAMQEKQNTSHAEQLQHASQSLMNQPNGSAKAYSQNLADAANMLQGGNVTKDNAVSLVTSILGGIAGHQAAGLPSTGGGLNAGSLLQAGENFMQGKQQGRSNMDALIGAALSAGPLSGSPARQQSGSLIGKTLMNVFGSMKNA